VSNNGFGANSDFLDEEIQAFEASVKVQKAHLKSACRPPLAKARTKGACRKIRYRSRKDALQALRTIKYLRERYAAEGHHHSKIERRAYRCSLCNGGYHLTSKAWAPPRESAKIIQLVRPVELDISTAVAHVA